MEKKMEQVINVELTVSEINTILASLAKMPYEVSADLIFKIRTQSLPQLKTEDTATTE
jgi:hypothetical protein